jgi:hypothetical protein
MDYCSAFDKYDYPVVIHDRVSLQNWTKLQTLQTNAAYTQDAQKSFIPYNKPFHTFHTVPYCYIHITRKLLIIYTKATSVQVDIEYRNRNPRFEIVPLKRIVCFRIVRWYWRSLRAHGANYCSFGGRVPPVARCLDRCEDTRQLLA